MSEINATDLFGTTDPKAAAASMERYTETLSDSIVKGLRGETSAPFLPAVAPSAISSLEALALNKSLAPEALSSLNSALEAQRSAGADLIKDITVSSPISTGIVAFDLEAPAKLLAPRPTPLRNRLPRKKGVGLSHRFKVISGFTGSGTGGVGNTFPGITDSTTTAFGSINYLRGPKIAYAGSDKVVPYKQFSLSDAVPFSAQFAGQGYQDIRQLSQTSVLYASMLMEERMLLMGRGTDSGFVGALAAPAIALTARTAAAGESALTGFTTKVYVYVTSDAGSFGQSVLSTVANVAVSAGQVVDVAITDAAGALGYRVYVGTGASQPADTAIWYAGRTGYNLFTLQGALPTSGTAASTIVADTSAYASGYDGMLPQIFAGGTVNRINAALSTSNPGVEFQNVFSTLYDGVKADPDEIYLNGADRKQLSDAIKSGSTANYRLTIKQDEIGGAVLGDVVTGLQNEVTGKGVTLTVHPWLPQGVAPVVSWTLPIPDSNVTDVWSVFNVQDYMAIEWPVTQLAYETSTYWNGTLVGYAPAWNGVVAGIKAV